MYDSQLYPWLNIWTRPRKTARWILDTGPYKLMYLIIILYGLTENILRAESEAFGEKYSFSLIIIMAMIVAPITGLIYWFIESHLIYWFGKMLGGTAKKSEVKEIYAWFGIFYVAMLALSFIQILLFGDEVFKENQPILDSSLLLMLIDFLIALVQAGLFIWFGVNLSLALAEANQFSGWRGFATLVLMAIAMILINVIFNLFFSILLL